MQLKPASKLNDYTKRNEQKNVNVTVVNSQSSPDKVSHLVSIVSCDVMPSRFTSLAPNGWGQVTRLKLITNCRSTNITQSQKNEVFMGKTGYRKVTL